MDQFMGSVGSYFFANRAKKEFDSLNDDFDNMGTAVGNFWSRMKGKVKKSLPDLLQEYSLPRGLFPKNIVNYEFDDTTGLLEVVLPYACEVGYRDQSIVRYARKVTAHLRPGLLLNVEGMKTKFVFWVKVTSVSGEEAASNKVHFQTTIRKTRQFDVYNYIRDGWEVDNF